MLPFEVHGNHVMVEDIVQSFRKLKGQLTKKIAGDEKSRLQTLSIGVVVPDKFIELAREG